MLPQGLMVSKRVKQACAVSMPLRFTPEHKSGRTSGLHKMSAHHRPEHSLELGLKPQTHNKHLLTCLDGLAQSLPLLALRRAGTWQYGFCTRGKLTVSATSGGVLDLHAFLYDRHQPSNVPVPKSHLN